ncbi:hypothetical protein K2Y00_03145 [Patescibacteria group bacterium]|nr:hypothetical protein [Patescibacteria group bacterium]
MADEREEKPSPLERMRKSLYTPGTSFDIQPSSLSARSSKMARTWEKEPEPEVKKESPIKISKSLIFLIGAAAFFVIAGLIAFFLVVQGGRSVSTDRISISIENPPTSIAGGDTVSLFVLIKNENPALLTDAKLSVDFPEGTYSAINATEQISHHIEKIGNIGPGESVKKTIRATLFGEANQTIKIPMTLEYRTEGSSATFEKEEEFSFVIGTSPVSVNVVALSEVASGQEMTFEVSVRSNSPTLIDDLAVRAEYPFGFSVVETTPSPVAGNLFSLGGLKPGEERKITITGRLTGQDQDERVFRFSAGTARADGSQNLATTYISKEALVQITRPFIAVDLTVDGSQADLIAVAPGRPVQSLLSWMNTLPSQIQDAELSVRLTGEALDKNSVTASGGFYRSSDTTVLFNRDSSPGLRTLQPGDSGKGSFSFATKPSAQLADLHNPSITITVSVAGRRVGETGVAEQVSSTLTRTIQVASELSLSAYATRVSGAYPPVADAETVYSVRFGVNNGVNAIADSVVKATLPSYVRFISSAGGSVTYNETTREVSWVIGELPAHAQNRSAAFDIAFLPSTSQRDATPVLVNSPVLSGFDRYVQKVVTDTVQAIDSGEPVE